MINVTKTHLPNKEKYQKYVDEIFESGWITNYGPKIRELKVIYDVAHTFGVQYKV